MADILVNLFDRVMGPMIGSSLVRVMGVGFITFYLELWIQSSAEGHPHYDPSNGVY